MKRLTFSVLALASGLSFQPCSWAEMSADFPTHCKAGEFAFLNARMGKFDKQQDLIQSGKILSLCADKPKEPFGQFVYRFGVIGNVEMEEVATPSNRFGIYSIFIGHNAGENIISFSKGPINYYVSDAVGMGSGVSLIATESGKKIANFFSGNDNENEFQSNLEEVDFEKGSSPVFMKKVPKDNLNKLLQQ